MFATFDSCSSITVIHHGITLKTDEAENETKDDEDQDYKILWKNPIETDIDAVMKQT